MAAKTMYHSELAKLGIINARINSEPTESKYPGKPKWVAMEINGDERYYNCENDECELALTGFKDNWVELEAYGSREEAAIRLEVTENPARRADTKEQIAAAKEKIANMKDQGEHNREPIAADEKPRPAAEKPKVIQAELGEEPERDSETSKLKSYAAHAGHIFALAWEESKDAMALIPTKDAVELTSAEWLDLRLRIAQGYAIEINKIIRKERF